MAASISALNRAQIDAIAARGGMRVVEATQLDGGMFASAYKLLLSDGRPVILKAAPVDGEGLMSHEHLLMRTEIGVLQLAATRPALLMPQLLYSELSRRAVPADVMIVSMLTGVRWDTVLGEMTGQRQRRAQRGAGAVLAGLHEIRGERFGYASRAPELCAPTWPAAFGLMMEAVLADAQRFGVDVEAGRVRQIMTAAVAALSFVRVPRLIHGDLWPGNVFIDSDSGTVTGVIDAERAFWGDPLADFAAAEPMSQDDPSESLIDGYRRAGGVIDLDWPARIRLALYRLHLTLIMTVEVVPRGYQDEWLPGHLRQLAEQRSALLAELAERLSLPAN